MQTTTCNLVRVFSIVTMMILVGGRAAFAGGGTEAQDQLALTTPEPLSLIMLGTALCYIAARLRRASRQRASSTPQS